MDYLRDILEDLKSRFVNKYSADDFQLSRQLSVLDEFEKRLIRKKVLELDYNIGSLRVIKVLKECDILSITDYLLAQTIEEDIQGIIADVIDLDTSQQLLKEVIKSTRSSEVINTQFHHCFVQYSADVINRPELIKNEFIAITESFLNPEDFWELIASRFLTELLSQEKSEENQENNENCDLVEVFSNQKDWNLKYQEQKFKLVCEILQKISMKHSEALVKLILKQLQMEKNVDWFHLLLIIRHVDQNSRGINDVKNYLKSLLKKFYETDKIDHLLMMFVVSRQFLHYNSISPSTYQPWVKQTIGEMNYNLKNIPKFMKIIDALKIIVSYENDLDIINAHAETAISSPRGAHHSVLEYKQMLRTKSASWNSPETVIDLD